MLGDPTVGEVAEPFSVSLPAISRHLRVLESARLRCQAREGTFRRCRLDPEGLRCATEWFEFHHRFWSGKGRDEANEPYPQAWVRRHDEYGD
jgi:DNA-binding transcriptional ArsR family regulator